MPATPTTPTEYIDGLEEPRRTAVLRLCETIRTNLPDGFEEGIGYGMLSWHVPHRLHPAGYHCDPKLPLPFLAVASQKSHIAVYHMGLYADAGLLEWFLAEWNASQPKKPDMGKSCLRFKNPASIPLDLIGRLVARMTPTEWIALYESQRATR